VDISENNMVELARDLRSIVGYGSGEFKTFAVDCGSMQFSFCSEDDQKVIASTRPGLSGVGSIIFRMQT
jgi:hypothetical protein